MLRQLGSVTFLTFLLLNYIDSGISGAGRDSGI